MISDSWYQVAGAPVRIPFTWHFSLILQVEAVDETIRPRLRNRSSLVQVTARLSLTALSSAVWTRQLALLSVPAVIWSTAQCKHNSRQQWRLSKYLQNTRFDYRTSRSIRILPQSKPLWSHIADINGQVEPPRRRPLPWSSTSTEYTASVSLDTILVIKLCCCFNAIPIMVRREINIPWLRS